MNRVSVFATTVALLTVLSTAGCNSTDSNNIQQDVSKLAQNSKEALSNAGMVARVNATLSQIKDVDVSGLHIEAENGVITVGGHVKDAQSKQRVLDTVKNIKDVNSVVANLRVQP